MCSSWTDWITALGTVAGAGAVGYAAWVAKRGIDAWRSETLGKRKIEIAERGYNAFTRVRGAFQHIRTPLLDANELLETAEYFNLSPPADEERNPLTPFNRATRYYLTFFRQNKNREVFEQVQELEPLFAAYFGEETGKQFKVLLQTHNKIRFAAEALIREQNRSGSAAGEVMDGFEGVIWDQGDGDKVANSIDTAVQEILDICKRVIKQEG